jgi:hypothetical protein
LSETRMTLTLTLIAVELSCALLWALSGTVAAGALTLTLGLGAVLVIFLPERYPPRGEGLRKPAARRPQGGRTSRRGRGG